MMRKGGLQREQSRDEREMNEQGRTGVQLDSSCARKLRVSSAVKTTCSSSSRRNDTRPGRQPWSRTMNGRFSTTAARARSCVTTARAIVDVCGGEGRWVMREEMMLFEWLGGSLFVGWRMRNGRRIWRETQHRNSETAKQRRSSSSLVASSSLRLSLSLSLVCVPACLARSLAGCRQLATLAHSTTYRIK